MSRADSPFSGANLRKDVLSGFLVFLIALPLCLGISMASGYPPVAGVLTAIVGGVLVSFLGSARLTIKGPAAGLIVIALGAVTELGAGDPGQGYRKALAVGVVAGVIQIGLAFARAGVIGDLMPPSVVHGMLAAIGVIIVSKQGHTLLGVTPESKEPLGLLAELPASVARLNPELFFIGAVSLLVLFGMPALRSKALRRVPAPLLVLLFAVPTGMAFDLDHEHLYSFLSHLYTVGPQYLVRLPGHLVDAIATPDFSEIGSAVSIKYVVMFVLVGSVESLLSVSAVDALDPVKRTSNHDRDLLALGIGNTVAAFIGGLPMISEIVRSKANIDNGATSPWANFFHGAFLLTFVALLPGLLQEIPLAALAAMLVYTGIRLASPSEVLKAYRIGRDQLVVFLGTLLVTLASDLLVGVGVGLALEVVIHLKNGASVPSLVRSRIEEVRDGDRLVLRVEGAAVFCNYIGLKRRLRTVGTEVKCVRIDFSGACVVDHTVLERLHLLANEWADRTLEIGGLEAHESASSHALAARRRRRTVVA
jgi:MFS superfamily sulfate permease-like transporter